MTAVLLGALVAGAQSIEAITGFGGTALSLALGVHLVPLAVLVPAMTALGWAQSVWMTGRHGRHVEVRLLAWRVLPWMLAGIAVGTLARGSLAPDHARWILGGVVISAALVDLLRQKQTVAAKRHPVLRSAALLGAGFCHGLFAAGGPLAVYAIAGDLPDKARFRATLAALWVVLNGTLLITFWTIAPVESAVWWFAAALSPAIVVGIVIGERLHHRVAEATFRRMTQGLLILAGVAVLL